MRGRASDPSSDVDIAGTCEPNANISRNGLYMALTRAVPGNMAPTSCCSFVSRVARHPMTCASSPTYTNRAIATAEGGGLLQRQLKLRTASWRRATQEEPAWLLGLLTVGLSGSHAVHLTRYLETRHHRVQGSVRAQQYPCPHNTHRPRRSRNYTRRTQRKVACNPYRYIYIASVKIANSGYIQRLSIGESAVVVNRLG
jgi:hypothetical protein